MHQKSTHGLRWSKASALALLLALSACSSQTPGGENVEVHDGALRGELVSYIANLDDGGSELRHFLRVGGDERNERRLIFTADPDLAPGVQLKVWGVDTGDQIQVTEYEIDKKGGDVGSASESLIGQAPYPNRTFAWVFVDIGGGAGTLNVDTARQRLVGMNPGDNSVKQYYREASYGTQDVTAEFFDGAEFRHAMTTCDTTGMASALRPLIPTTFQHYLWYFRTRTSACSWSGLAQLGTPQSPRRDTWYNGSSGCVVLVQEPGHNFGMQHSSSMRCGSTPFSTTPQTACTHSEYGNRFDPMGGGCRHMNAWQKSYQGWFGGCNSVRVGQSGTFTLHPIENACNGIQVLQIPIPNGPRPMPRSGGGGSSSTVNLTHYYLELRASYGFDNGIANSVLVHVGPEYRTRSQTGLHTWIIDMAPSSTGSHEGMRAGESYTDPAGGLTFAVESISTTQASIRVEMSGGTGSSTCMDNTTLAPPGPASCGMGGTAGTGGTSGTGGTGGTAGTSGTGGTGGTAGTSGTGGTAGTSGTAGTGGTDGSSGTGGTNGSSGTGGTGTTGTGGTGTTGTGGTGTTGTGGTGTLGTSGSGPVGSGGDGATGGAAGVSGEGGTSTAGGAAGTRAAGGAAGAGPGAGGDGDSGRRAQLGLSESDGGCTCTTTPSPRSGAAGLLLGVGVLGLLGRRRRRS